MIRPLVPAALLLLAGCVDSTDPAEGGFINGVSGVTSGTYDRRVAEREQQVAAAQAENARLSAELSRLRGEHASVKNRIVQQRAALAAKGVRLSPASEREVQMTLNANPARAEDLRRAIADARELSARLTRLSSG